MPLILKELFNGIFQIFTAPLFQMGKEAISLVWILKLILSLSMVAFLSTIVKRFLKYRLLGRLGIDPGNREAIATLISYVFCTIGCIIVIQFSGFDLATFALIAGGLGVGIGFGLQDITKNLVSGLTLLLERKLKVGDYIEFDSIGGYIDEISIRSVVLRRLDGNEVIIPNSKLVESQIVNKSYTSFKGLVRIPVGVAYGSDPVLVTEILLNSAYMDVNVLEEPSPKVIFNSFGDNALNFELFVWVNTVDKELLIRSSLNFIIEHNLRKANIQIPFPQRDIWLKNPEALQVTSQPDSHSDNNKTPASSSFYLRDLLRQVTYFQALSDIHLRSLIEMGRRIYLEESKILCRQGDPGNAFFIVLSGAIEATYEQEGTERQLFTFSAGQFFGELPLMLGVSYPTTMRAISDTILFTIARQSFGNLLKSYPGLGEAIVQELASRQEIVSECERQLKATHPDNTDNEKNPVIWLKNQVRKLFVS